MTHPDLDLLLPSGLLQVTPFNQLNWKPEGKRALVGEVHRGQPPGTQNRVERGSVGENGEYPKQLCLWIFFGSDNMEFGLCHT